MESTDNSYIHQWLSNLPERLCDDLTHPAVETLVQMSLPFRPSAKPVVPKFDTGHDVRRSNVEVHDLEGIPKTPAGEKGFGKHLEKKRKQGFEHRARHKTRQDRYEYKSSAPTGHNSRSHKTRRTKQQRRRKHTMNDSFHAQNVPADRLTLPHIAGAGIFNKGKASSPIKLGDVPDLAFSETNFLSRGGMHKSINDVEARSSRKKDGNGSQSCQRLFEYKVYDTPAPRGMKRRRSQQENDVPTMPSESKRRMDPFASAIKSEADPILDTLQHGTHDSPFIFQPASQTKTKGDIEGRLSTPLYGWSESEPDVMKTDRTVESYLLDLLHCGLDLEQLADTSSVSHSNKRYWSLDELKKLLEERRLCWEPATSQQDQEFAKLRTSSSSEDLLECDLTRALPAELSETRNETPRETIRAIQSVDNKCQPCRREGPGLSNQAFDNEVSCACPPPSLPPEGAVDSSSHHNREEQNLPRKKECLEDLQESLNGLKRPLKRPLQNDRRPSCSEVEGPVQDFRYQLDPPSAQPYLTSDLGNIILCEDDELFYCTMDAAYDAIVNPYDVQGRLQDGSIPKNVLIPCPYEDAGQLTGAEGPPKAIEEQVLRLRRQSSHLALGASQLSHNDPSPALNGLSHGIGLQLDEALPEETQRFSCLTDSHKEQLLTATVSAPSFGPTCGIAGFWRQNKLY